jgi:hypothetical protein
VQANKDLTDKNFLLLSSNFAGLVDNIRHKSGNAPELGRILNDKGYRDQKMSKKDKGNHHHFNDTCACWPQPYKPKHEAGGATD